jgi:release factor glutamine methyltransferase
VSTIAQALSRAAQSLGAASDSPRLDAEVLLCHLMGKDRSHLRAWPEAVLAADLESRFQGLVARRLEGLPIAYLTGSREFWSREFQVSPAVLIPRPETELLVELALARLPGNRPLHIADLGTGSGIIAITLALELPAAEVVGVDISDAALDLARVNAMKLGANRVKFRNSDWFEGLSGESFDLIAANPPYIANADPHLKQGDVRFEPRSALSAGPDGLRDIRRIVQDARAHLVPGGWLLMEHGYDQAAEVRALLSAAGYTEAGSFPDLQGHLRVSGGRRP